MQARIRTAIVLSTVTGLTGVWLVLAPFILGYQPSGDPWITATTHHVATGAVLALISWTTVFTMIGGALRILDGAAEAAATPDRSHLGSRERDARVERDTWNR
jgi:hypothetical protein